MSVNITKYYKILNVTPGASENEIEEAYLRARETYGQDSSATYSLYSPQQREEMLKEITEAYNILTSPDKNFEYEKVTDETARESAEVEEAPEVPELTHGVEFKSELVVMENDDPLPAEQYRILFTKIEKLSTQNSSKVFAITSAVKGEGKTMTSLNLSYVMASEFKKKTMLLECDFKHPSISNDHLSSTNEFGLLDVLNGTADLSEAIIRLKNGLHILPASRTTGRSSELLGSENMKKVLKRLRQNYDFIIMDCTPILPLADVNILAGLVDGFLLVVKANFTRQDLVKKAVDSITDGKFVGVVFNAADSSLKKYYY